jgi:rhodanese-related sulfurtransferase
MKYWLFFLPLVAALMIGKTVMADELQIETLTAGDGMTAEAGKRVSVHYEGRLADGSVFDASRPRGQPFAFTIGAGQVIRGWEEGVDGMQVGESRRLTIPPELGYGAEGAGDVIPPNATLVFEIELLSVGDPIVLGEVDSQGLQQAQRDGAVLVDIRLPNEWADTGVIQGAHTITAFLPNGRVHPEFLDSFQAVVPSPDIPVMLYCASGGRTSSLGNALIEQLGYTNVSHLSGGIVEWIGMGNETDAYKE